MVEISGPYDVPAAVKAVADTIQTTEKVGAGMALFLAGFRLGAESAQNSAAKSFQTTQKEAENAARGIPKTKDEILSYLESKGQANV
ncbi:hypothetical protein FAI40_09965 [Acetobacteraceae bacterium]|nr:hypothetical protein FAI40_09965 [Acetobacteraceae bacterium]